MTAAEKISIALLPEMVLIIRAAVATGEYASSSEVIRDALRDWTCTRSLRLQGITELRGVWQEASGDQPPGLSPDEVLTRLERKYQTIADAAGETK
ncbi:antitoxin ParD1/3/4 [Oxalobacteraceae bacterium GrIS 2.11]